MAEYIDRETLIADIDEEIEHDSKMYTREQNYYIEKGLRIARKDIKSAPAADVAEVKHGKWEWGYGLGGQYGIWCTNCGAGYVDSPNAEWIAQEHDYCGKCGAKMDGKDGEKE